MAQSTKVYQFERFFLEAIATIFEAEGLQVNTFLDDEIAVLPRIDGVFSVQNVMPEPTQMIDLGDGRRYQSRYTALISLTATTSAFESKLDHFELVGRIRNQMSYLQPRLIEPVLPFYTVHNLHEQSSNHAVSDESDNEIMTQLNFQIIFSINPSAFLAGYFAPDGEKVYLQPDGESLYLQS